MKKLFTKYKSVIAYLFFGVLTTIINVIGYYVCAHIFNLSTAMSTGIAWLTAVLVAYLTNRKWVFDSQACTIEDVGREILSFLFCRISTGVIDVIIMAVFVDLIGVPDLAVKFFSNIVVVVLNYVASKVFIFK